MEMLLNIVVSICVCSVFMYWYEKKLAVVIQTLIEKMTKISIEVIEEAIEEVKKDG